jgi:hypothetical protein
VCSPSKAKRKSRAAASNGAPSLYLRNEPDTPIVSDGPRQNMLFTSAGPVQPGLLRVVPAPGPLPLLRQLPPELPLPGASAAPPSRFPTTKGQCLEPPLAIDELPSDEWYCKACEARDVRAR